MISSKSRRGWSVGQWLVLAGLVLVNAVVASILFRLVSASTQTSSVTVEALTLPSPTPSVLVPTSAPLTNNTATTLVATAAPAQPLPTPSGLVIETPRTLVPTLPPLILPLSQLPSEASVQNIGGRKQTYSLSCEARAAADWAAYFGYEVDELTFLSQLPASDDPDLGFVGDVHGQWGQIPPNPYGVHAGPVARLLKQHYGVPAQQRHFMSLEDLHTEIALGQPVIVWVVGHVEANGERVRYTTSTGREVTVAPFEHTVMVVGYTSETITILDGARRYTRPVEVFLDSWAILGNMAIVYNAP